MGTKIGLLTRVFLILSLLIFAVCTATPYNINQVQSDSNYAQEVGINTSSLEFKDTFSAVSITFEYYEDISEDKFRNISIKYPQVSRLRDIEFMKTLNKKLSPPYFEGDEDDRLTIEIWSEYSLVGDEILSFCFYRNINRFDSAHPYSYMWGVTVNTENEEYLDLSDIVRIDEEFKELFLNGCFVSDRFSYDELLEFESLDSLYDRIYDFYLTKSTLVVIANTYHIAGDYLVFEIPYTDIWYLLNPNYKFLIGL